MRMKLAAALVLFAGPALAQSLPMPGAAGPQGVPQKAPPVKKFNGVCYPPDSLQYKRITDGFFPFVGMIDCLKSGGVQAGSPAAKK